MKRDGEEREKTGLEETLSFYSPGDQERERESRGGKSQRGEEQDMRS